MTLEPPEKLQFFDLLNRAVQSDDPAIREKAKCGSYNGKSFTERLMKERYTTKPLTILNKQ